MGTRMAKSGKKEDMAMRVSGVGGGSDMQTKGAGMSPGVGEPMDEVSRSLQKQIESLQKQIKELASNQEMPAQIKMKKKQELQKQISDLQIQLRQHQMEVKREEARKKEEKAAQDDVLNPNKGMEQKQGQNAGLSAGNMEAMLSADASMKQAGVHGSTARHAQNRAGILESEIKRDKGGPGAATAAKEEALAKTKALAEKATASQMDSLNKTNEVMKNASEAEKNENGRKEEETGKNDEAVRPGETGAGRDHAAVSGNTLQDADGEKEQAAGIQATSEADERMLLYHPVDVRI